MPGTNLGQAYVQIMPSAKGIGSNLSKTLSSELGGAGESIGGGLSKSIGGTLIKGLAALGIGAAVKKLFSEAIQAGAEMQQSFGGMDTIYGKASEELKNFAYQASQAGLSANDYAEQAVSFGAALTKAWEYDAATPAEAQLMAARQANQVILDMQDNAAKMGTDISNIQNAYQGFAKQNYTMLDNLKLGYGGTKQEMERLLEHATELSGLEYNINNLSDVYEAIHVVQEELGLTGVAAKEGATTFSGSMAAMKASATNLLANLALGEDIKQPLMDLVANTKNFLVGNLFPMIGNILKQIPGLLGEGLKWAFANIPGMVDAVIKFINNLAAGMTQNSGKIKETLAQIGRAALEMFKNIDWKGLGLAVLNLIGTAIMVSGSLIWDGLRAIGEKAAEWFRNVNWSEVGGSIILAIGNGIAALAGHLWEGIRNIGQNIWNFFANTDWTGIGKTIIVGIINGLFGLVSSLWEGLRNIGQNIWDSFTKTDWSSVGSNIISGIVNGINSAGHWIWDTLHQWAQNAWQNVKNFFGISSPSKLMEQTVGRWIPLGMAEGIEAEGDSVVDAMNDIAAEASTAIDTDFKYNATVDPIGGAPADSGITINVYPSPGMDERALADMVQQRLALAQRQRQTAWGMA